MTTGTEVVHAWAWGGHLLMACLVMWAFWRGGNTERLCALIILVGWMLTPLVQTVGVIGLDPGTTLVDSTATLLLIWLSEKKRQLWLLFAASCAVLGTTGHFATAISSPIGYRTYFFNNGFWSGYMLLFALFIGLVNAERTRLST